MGKREVRIVVVRKRTSVFLLLVVSAAMAALLYYLSGRAYASTSNPATEVLERLIFGTGERPSRDALLAALMPVIASMLVFTPWGFLMFVALDSPRRRRRTSYLITFAAGLLFATALGYWQHLLPTRVTSSVDAIANALGALAGAVGGHLRKQVRVQFEY